MAHPTNANLDALKRAALNIECTWLGFQSPPLHVRLEQAGWSRESTDAACPRCGATAGPNASDSGGCRDCRSQKLPWERFIRLGVYSGVLGEIVREVKFGRFRTLGVQAGHMLGEVLARQLDDCQIPVDRVWIVPVPMSRRRYLERGIDHSLCAARGVSAAVGARLVRVLIRSHGPTQLAVVPSDRRRNVTGIFRSRRISPRIPRPYLIVVVDDVRTTGATLASACRTVRKSFPTGNVAEGDRVRLWAAALTVADARPPGSPAA